MRARNIKPGFWRNESLGVLPAETRLLFIGLWGLADREGRLENRPVRIQADLFPYQATDVATCLASLAAAGFVDCYHADGRDVIQVINFAAHQRPHPRELPSQLPPRHDLGDARDTPRTDLGDARDEPRTNLGKQASEVFPPSHENLGKQGSAVFPPDVRNAVALNVDIKNAVALNPGNGNGNGNGGNNNSQKSESTGNSNRTTNGKPASIADVLKNLELKPKPESNCGHHGNGNSKGDSDYEIWAERMRDLGHDVTGAPLVQAEAEADPPPPPTSPDDAEAEQRNRERIAARAEAIRQRQAIGGGKGGTA